MEIRTVRRLPFYIGLVFSVFLIGLATKELVVALSATVLAEQDAELEREWEFNARLKNVAILLKDAELGVHAYFISGNRSFLPEPNKLKAHYDAELNRLKTILPDNQGRQKDFEQFRNFTSRHLQQLEEEIAASVRGELEVTSSALPEPLSGNWENIRILNNLETGIEAKQTAMIRQRQSDVHYRYWSTLAFCVAACVAFMFLLVLFYRMNRRYSAQLHLSQKDLQSKNKNLENDLALRADQLSELSHHLLAISEQEKATLARELHDELGSNLTAIRLDLLAVLKKIKRIDSCLATQIKEALALLQKTFDIKRRIIESLHPSTLENLGLSEAIRIHADEVAQRSGLRIDVTIEEDIVGIGSSRAIALYRIAQESLTNTTKYAKAKHVSISLSRNPKGLRLQIFDDGIGFKKNALSTTKSHGILGMRERATLLGGTFEISSKAGGYGTHIDVLLPHPTN